MDKIEIKINRCNNLYPDIPLPSYETDGSAGMDIRAAIKECAVVEPGKLLVVPTNLSVEIPAGFELQVRPRSGLACKHGIGILNSPGTIDSDYRGEIKIILFNFGDKDFTIRRGDRIAQIIVSKVYRADFKESGSLSNTSRGKGGFGHTGKN